MTTDSWGITLPVTKDRCPVSTKESQGENQTLICQNVPEADRTGSPKESLRPSSEGSKCHRLEKYHPPCGSHRPQSRRESPTKRDREPSPKLGTLPVHNQYLKEACVQKSGPCSGQHQSCAPAGARSCSAPSPRQRTTIRRLLYSLARLCTHTCMCTRQPPLSAAVRVSAAVPAEAEIQSGRPSSPTQNLNRVEGEAAFWGCASK